MNPQQLTKINETPIHEDQLKKNFPKMRRPKVCGYFSLDSNRDYLPNISQLKYLHDVKIDTREVDFDLNRGIERAVRKPDDLDEGIAHMLYFILYNYRKVRNPDFKNTKLLTPDIVCYRGLLTHMMDSMYHNDNWTVLVTNWKGTIYLSEIKNKPNYNIPKRKMDMFCSWGFKMEQYLLTSKYGEPPDIDEPVVESEEFCVMFHSNINNKEILYGAEMDGIISENELTEPVEKWDDVEFVEIKTNRKIDNYRQDINLRKHKFIKWWAQSFLVGIDKVYCGFRDDNGICTEVRQFTSQEITKGAYHWDPNICMNLCNRFLDTIRETVPASDDPNVVYRVEWTSKNGMHCIETWSTQNERSILPNWYTERILKLLKH